MKIIIYVKKCGQCNNNEQTNIMKSNVCNEK
jgi:hypothetical protein